MYEIIIYTDGSCMPNPGKGGWAFVALEKDYQIEMSGYLEKATNNAMELTAVIEALKTFSHYVFFHIYSDSMYVINCATKKWKRKANIELWGEYEKYSKGKKINWTWVKGHSNDKYNDLVDKLAKKEIF